MHILSLSVREFGGLKDLSVTLGDGLNLIEGSNESGKSTLLAFIRFLFYGLRPRSAGEELSDADRAYSWKSGTASGGMTLSFGGSVYRIERHEHLGNPEKHLLIVNETTGEVLPRGTTPEELFLGIPRTVFDGTVAIRQLRGDELGAAEISAEIENLVLSGDASVDADKALTELEKARRVLLHKNGKGGEIYRKKGEIDALGERLRALRARDGERIEAERELEALRRELSEERNALRRAETAERMLGDAALLRRLDALEEAEREAAASEREIRKARAESGLLTKEAANERVRVLEEHAVRLDIAARERLLAKEAVRSTVREGDPALRGVADAIRAVGGTDRALARLRAMRHRRGFCRAASILFSVLAALLAAILAAVGYATGLVPLYPLAALLGVGLLALALVFGGRARQAAREIPPYLARFGLTGREGSPEAALISLATRAFREVEDHGRRDEAARRLSEAEAAEERVRNAALRDAGGLFGDGSAVTPEALRHAAAAVREREHAIRRSEDALHFRRQQCERERGALKDVDGDALRRRLSAKEAVRAADPEALHREIEARRARIRALDEQNLALTERHSALSASIGDPNGVLSELEVCRADCEALEAKHRAILLAMKAIEEARGALRASVSPRLRRDASDYLAAISGGRYAHLELDRELLPSPESEGVVRPAYAFSIGTKDAIYLALRLALADLFGKAGEPLPLLLDEALSQLDDERACAVLRLLLARSEKGGQALLFTCHSREGMILTDLAAPRVTRVKL